MLQFPSYISPVSVIPMAVKPQYLSIVVKELLQAIDLLIRSLRLHGCQHLHTEQDQTIYPTVTKEHMLNIM